LFANSRFTAAADLCIDAGIQSGLNGTDSLENEQLIPLILLQPVLEHIQQLYF
jgi:hypothetical protein